MGRTQRGNRARGVNAGARGGRSRGRVVNDEEFVALVDLAVGEKCVGRERRKRVERPDDRDEKRRKRRG